MPRWNPFDALYNSTLGRSPGRFRLGTAPAPRRFAQGMASALALAIGGLLLAAQPIAAWGLEAFFALAVVALVFGRFCLGSFLFHLLTGRAARALRTLPWARTT